MKPAFSLLALWQFLLIAGCFPASDVCAADLKLLFIGDNGHHRPRARFQELAPALKDRGVELQYTVRMEDLNSRMLTQFDGLVLYANIDRIEDDQAKAVLDFVAGGKGFIPIHCATYCWRNNKEMVALMGGQFRRHGGQVFTTQIAAPDHPIMKGYGSFTSWDETYIHHLHNEKDRTVLEYRVEGDQVKGKDREPWTWARTHGRGRVFYTAWGHDSRTFTQPGFHNLVERGIRWACGDDPQKVPSSSNPNTFAAPPMTALPKDVAKFEYIDVGPKIPNYTPGARWGTQGKPRNLMQKPLSAEESIKHFVTPEGMTVRLYADERNFQAKPIAMSWDERGRLWVCETVDYPNELGGNRDRVRICEDTDGDHIADKFTVFAEGLSIPTAIAIVRNGAIVQNGTETIYLKDTDGDDVSDQKTTLITGWALGDTHGGVSNFRYGLDNWIWAMQGYNNSTPHVDGKPTQTFRQGFWRFKLSKSDPPKVTNLEFIRSSNNNTWGLGISEDGLIFGSTANHNPSMFVPIPNRYYERVRGWAPATLKTIADAHHFKPITDKIRQVDNFGGYTAGAGHALYTARAFPQQWWNKTAFVCGPTGHLVGTFVLHRDGSNYSSTSPANLLVSDDEWCAPIMAEVGPDGAVWVIDWYNYVVQHNPTPQGFKTGKGRAYESDLRDKRHGRIYRIVAQEDDRDTVHVFSSLAGASNAALVETLKHPSFVWRLHAQRLLIEREANDVFQPLVALATDRSVDEIGLNVGAIHSLHTLHGLGYVNLDTRLLAAGLMRTCLEIALKHSSGGVRQNAIAVLPHDEFGLELLLANESLFTDKDAQVQLQAILTLADMPPSEKAGPLVAELGSATTDPILIDGITSAAAAHAIPYLTSLAAQKDSQTSAANLQVARRVTEHIARGRPDVAQLQSIVAGPQATNSELADAMLDGLATGIPADFEFKTTDAFDATLVVAFDNASAASKGKLIRLAGKCGTKVLDPHVKEIVQSLVAVVGDEEAQEEARVAAARDLVGFRSDDAEIAGQIVAQINARTSPEFARQLLGAVQLSRSASVADAIVDAAPALTPRLKSAAIDTLLIRATWATSLLAAIESGMIDLGDLSLEQKQALRSYPDKKLRIHAKKLLSIRGGLPDADRERVLKSLLHLTKLEGNVEAGRATFKKVCSACHKHGEMGHNIGPNLTGMAVHPKAELLTHIIDPSRNVEGNFRVYVVVTADGQVINGMLAGETRTSITIIDAKAEEIRLPREDIDQLVASRKSLMPEGFEKQITEEDLSNLLEFLTDKGQFIPVPLDRYATAISTKGLFHDGDNGSDRMIFPDWMPKVFKDIPFVLTDPRGKTAPNIILLNGPYGTLPPKMPKSVSLPCNTPAKAIHLLSGVGGWNYPYDRTQTVSMIVRLHYADGKSEDHKLINGVHFADYIRRVDVPKSEFAWQLGNQQIRYLAISPKRSDKIDKIELVKGNDNSSPIVMAITIERSS